MKVEGDKVPAYEVARQMEQLKSNLELRKSEKYIDPKTEKEKEIVTSMVEGGEDEINSWIEEFYGIYSVRIVWICVLLFRFILTISTFITFTGNAIEYITKWTTEYAFFNQFSWVSLATFPEWTTVKTSFQVLSERTGFDMDSKSAQVFQQFGYVKSYCNEDKLSDWKKKNVSTDAKWVEVFQHMEKNSIPFEAFSSVIEYILCFPGTSASAERLFAEVLKIWTQHNTQISIDTLKSTLFVKNYFDYTCIEFHRFLKSRPNILKQISSQDKYDFKQTKPSIETSPGAMSVGLDESELETTF